MFRNKVFFVFFSALLLLPLASNSEAVLWDLLIQANIENPSLMSGDRPIVSGVILDHASKPVQKATVNVKSESMSIFTTTSQSGEFLVELGKAERIPGNYIVNISATTSDGRMGIASIQFQVKGELAQTTVNHEKLSTPEAKRYLEASIEDFDKNPIGFLLYNYYQKIHQEYLEDQKIESDLAQEQTFIEEQKEAANESRQIAIEEFNPGAGIFSGPEYENYVNSLDEEIRDTVVEHLNFTKNLFFEANILKNEILENGGTAEEAQMVYLDKLSTSRDTIENFDSNSDSDTYPYPADDPEFGPASDTNQVRISDTPQSNTPAQPINEKSFSESRILVIVDGINVEVDYVNSIFSVNVNGTILEFLASGTEIILLENTE
ncbi:MAG TPA: carboxypeptidase regulatory-like domain-containing protein [Nitrosopumilaceae archaeon]|nr:carboxypeptidase regulatory-like domain-containing protein [Nitrosopumilaceae archaeon]